MRKTTLARVFGWGSTEVMVRLACSFISIKFTAVYIGPAGLAIVSQLSGMISAGNGLLGSGLQTAMARLIPEARRNGEDMRVLLGTGALVSIVAALLAFFATFAFSAFIENPAIDTAPRWWLIILTAAAIPALVLNSFVIGLLNGRGKIERLICANIVGAVLTLFIFSSGCYFFGLLGALIATALSFPVCFLATVFLCGLDSVFSDAISGGCFSKESFHRILKFYPMLIAHAALAPISLVLVRDHLIASQGVFQAGIWQASFRMSDVYTSIIAGPLALYAMPKIGEISKDLKALRLEIWRLLAIAVSFTAVFALLVYLARNILVVILFAPSFASMVSLLEPQLIGDVFKMGAWLLGLVMVALLKSRWYISAEIVYPALMVMLVECYVMQFGVVAANWAYLVANAARFTIGMVALRAVLFSRSALFEGRQ